MQNDQVTILKDYSDSYTKNGLGGAKYKQGEWSGNSQ